MYEYAFVPGSRVPLDPQATGQRLEEIRNANDGRLTPEAVVDDARPKTSPLHDAFEWSDRKAAEMYRIEQARGIIRAVVVRRIDGLDVPPVRSFVVVRQGADDKRTYTHIGAARSDAELWAQVVLQAKTELGAWRRKYNNLERFAPEFSAVTAAVDGLFTQTADEVTA